MISLKKHGVWVRHKEFGWEGRIAYFDSTTRWFWVEWDPEFKGKPEYRQKGYHYSGWPASALLELRFEPSPWFRKNRKKVKTAIGD